MLLRDCAKGREKETQLHNSHNFMKTHIVKQVEHQLYHFINKHVYFENTRNFMGLFNDENKLHVDEKNRI